MLHNQEIQINELQQQLKAGVEDIKSELPDDVSVSDVLDDGPTHSFQDEHDDAELSQQIKASSADEEKSSS